MHTPRWTWALVALGALGAPSARGEDAPAAPAAPAAGTPPAPAPAPRRPRRDPTEGDLGAPPAPPAPAAPPAPPPVRLPALVLRGVVAAEGRAPAALLEVGGVLATVADGSVLAAPSPGGRASLRVVEVTEVQVVVEETTTGERAVLR